MAYFAVGIIDREKHVIPNRLLVIILAMKSGWLLVSRDFEMIKNGLLGLSLMIAAGFMFYTVSRVIKKTEAIGFGDYKYLITLGYSCGIDRLLCVFLSSLVTAILMLTVCLCRKCLNIRKRMAMAPCLSIGAILFG